MNSFITTLSDAVLSKNFESCDLAELKTLSQAHPYSSAIQLLYAKKLKQSGSSAYSEQLQQTLLYYSNPLFIKHLLEADERKPVSQDKPTTRPAVTAMDETISELPVVEDFQDIVEGKTEEAAEIATTPVAANKQEEAHLVTRTVEPSSAIILSETETAPIPEDAEEEEEDIDDDASLPPLPKFTFEPVDPAKAELAFMPYHTVDYFAAQGIKLGDENSAADRFGTQLKSFTAWLKQMKRLPGATAKGNITVTEEKSIEQMAEQSLKGENADTEAMAQVWAKQGNPKKAIEIYKKLSLQIPAKSAYFAAKIDHLKK